MSNNRFTKQERLCSRYLIDQLFEPGRSKSLTAWPMRLVYRIVDEESTKCNALLISVPKRQFRHAVDRNRVKRQIREAYRTNKTLVSLPEHRRALMAVIWLDHQHYPSATVVAKVQNLLQRLTENVRKDAERIHV